MILISKTKARVEGSFILIVAFLHSEKILNLNVNTINIIEVEGQWNCNQIIELIEN